MTPHTQPRERLYGVWQPIERDKKAAGHFRYVYDSKRRDWVPVEVGVSQ